MTEKSSKENQEYSGRQSMQVEKTDASSSSSIEKNSQTKSKQSKKQLKPRKEIKPLSKLAALALLVALIVGITSAYSYFILYTQGMLTDDFANTRNEANARIQNLEQTLASTKNTLNNEIQARKNVEDEFSAFKINMEAMATKFGRTSNEWQIAEVEYLLTIANQRLNLTHDVGTTIAILESADQRLKSVGDPALLNIRKTIKDELIKLNAVHQPDIAGMVLSFGSLADTVNDLPLVDKERVAVATGQIKDQAPENWKDIPTAVWNDIKSLVVVRRHEQPTEPLLPPEEAWFLYQNLRLKFEQARLATLRRDTAMLRQNLKEADAWIGTFFNKESSLVINALKTTSELAKVELSPAIPDVNGSLRQLRNLMAERGVKIGSK